MSSANRTINVFEEDIAETLREAVVECTTWDEVAHSLGKSLRTVYYYGQYGNHDINTHNNRLKAHEIPFLPRCAKQAVLRLLKDKCKEPDHFDLNGEIDDEFCDLAELFGGLRERFKNGGKITKLHKDSFMQIAEKMFAEIEEKQK